MQTVYLLLNVYFSPADYTVSIICEYMYQNPARQSPIAPAVSNIAMSRQSNRLAHLPLSQSVFDRTMYPPGYVDVY